VALEQAPGAAALVARGAAALVAMDAVLAARAQWGSFHGTRK
jgi:hypothetical protein